MSPTYKIENVPQAMRDLSVQGVRFVTHSMGPVRPEGQISYNHWTIFLLVQDGAIRLSMQNQESNPNNNMGVLEISKLDYQTSRNATIYWDFPPMPSALVGHYFHNVYANGRHRYRMAEKGAGCRWWVGTVNNDWQLAGLVQRSLVCIELDQVLPYNWSWGHGPVLLEIKKGEFY